MNASFVSHWHYIMHVILSVRDGSETSGGSKGQIMSNLQFLLPAWISVIPTLCNWWPRISRWSLVGILRTLTNMQQDLLSLNYGEESSVVPYFKDVLVFFEGNTSAHIDMIVPIPAWPLKGPSEWCVQFCCLPWFPLERWGFSLQLQHILYPDDVLRQILHSFFPLHLGLQRSAIPLRCQLWQHTGLYWWLGWFQLTLCQKISPKAFEAVAGLYRELTKPYVFCHAKKKRENS